MTKDAAIMRAVLSELERAELLHPKWPDDIVHQAAIVAEEAGELLQAANNLRWGHKGGTVEACRKEAIQAAAMALRFIVNLGDK